MTQISSILLLLMLFTGNAFASDQCRDAIREYDSCMKRNFDGTESKMARNECISAVVYAYTQRLYRDLNRYLRNDIRDELCVRATELIVEGLSAFPIVQARVFRRQNQVYEPLLSTKEGQCFREKGFLSTSLNRDYGEDTPPQPNTTNVPSIYLYIEGFTGRLVESISAYPEEREVLFKPNTVFRLLRIEGKKHFLEEVLPPYSSCPNPI